MKANEKEQSVSDSPSGDLGDRRKILNELVYREERKAHQAAFRRMLFISSFALIIIGVFFWVQTTFVAEFFIYGSSFDENNRNDREVAANVKLFGSFFILISTVIFSYLYMAGFDPRKHRERNKEAFVEESSSDDNLVIVSLLKSIDESLEKGKLESVLSAKERAEIINKISETVESQLNDSLLSKIEEKYGLAVHNQKLANAAEESLGSTVSRLKGYADKLQEKASVNLVWGIASTLTAIMILALVLINASPPKDASHIVTVFYYTSRLLLVFLVQGISIFFLNLYKTTLNNIMYISNEITNYEAKRDALVLSLNSGNADVMKSLLLSLSLTERNFTLRKGETSIFSKTETQQPEAPTPAAVVNELLSKLAGTKE